MAFGAVLAIAAAVAGGNLAVTAAPTRTYPGHRVVVRATGQVGDSGGRLYLYRNLGTGCRASVDAEHRLGRGKVPIGRPRAIPSTFDFSTSYRAGRGGTREWVCGYLYVINCDAAGNNCGVAWRSSVCLWPPLCC